MSSVDIGRPTRTVTLARPVGGAIAALVGVTLQGVIGVLVSASGLMMPMWAIVALWVVWVTGLTIQIRHRHRPLVVVTVPLVIAAIWVLTATLGEALLGWTA